jgi:uncharacterized protein YlaN (UPF0358 family)
MEAPILNIQYHHTTLNQIYSIDREISYPEFLKFQESNNPKELGYTYERDYSEAKEQEPETV